MKRVSLYLHFPYCRSRCTYCDFNAYHEPSDRSERRAYLEALLEDIRRQEPARLRTVFCGGGTPSLTDPDWLREVLDACRETFLFPEEIEVTLEANPGTVDAERLQALRGAGFNRISLGVQSFHARQLEAIGRIHSGEEAVAALCAARRAGFDNVNLDLIYGLPEQTLEDWEDNLRRIAELRPEHLSAYALTVEPHTRLEAQIRQGERQAPDEDLQADMAERIPVLLGPAGYRRYEISNWALPRRECRHNLTYWRNQEYLGLGCGASSFVDGWRTRRILHPHHYAEALARGRSPVIEHERLGAEGASKDALILALRTRWGADLERLYRRYPIVPGRLEAFLDSLPPGLVQRRNSRARLTRKGQAIANVVFVEALEWAFTVQEPEPVSV